MMPLLSSIGQGIGQFGKQMGQNFLQNQGIMPIPGAATDPQTADPMNPQGQQAGPRQGLGFVQAIRAAMQQHQQPQQQPRYSAMGDDGSYLNLGGIR